MIVHCAHDAIPKTARKHPVFKIACDIDGQIYSLKTGKPRALWKTKHGYLQLAVGRTSYLAHRLIADVFVKNPKNKPFVNHINGIKSDNRVGNLEWCTQLENVRHARDVLGVKFSKSGMQNANARFMESHQIILANLYLKGFSQAWISDVMGFSKPTIKRHLDEIRAKKS